jgi:hypothetical protein
VDFLREPQLDRRAAAHWGIRLPPHVHPGSAREALTLLLRAGVPPDTILKVLQAFGVVFEDKTLFADSVEAWHVDPFRMLGIAAVVAAFSAVVAAAIELVSTAL